MIQSSSRTFVKRGEKSNVSRSHGSFRIFLSTRLQILNKLIFKQILKSIFVRRHAICNFFLHDVRNIAKIRRIASNLFCSKDESFYTKHERNNLNYLQIGRRSWITTTDTLIQYDTHSFVIVNKRDSVKNPINFCKLSTINILSL